MLCTLDGAIRPIYASGTVTLPPWMLVSYDDADACDPRERVVRTDRPEMPDADKGSDDPNPGPPQDMQHRLDDLPPGHPSSPYNEDGSHKPRPTRWQDLELAEPDQADPSAADRHGPLTDSEHAAHITEVRSYLAIARECGLVTDQQHTIDRARQVWTDEREVSHDSIIEDLYKGSAGVPNEHRAILAGGLAGAGKSTVLDRFANIDRSQYLTINPDDIKEEMAKRGLIPQVGGLSPMEASDLVHEESSHIAKRLAMLAQADGKNIIWDITMRTRNSTEGRIDDLRMAGYTCIEGIFVDIPVETSVARADARHRAGHDDYLAGKGLGGRFVPEEIIRGQADSEWGSVNRRTFEAVKGRFNSWSIYDNSADGGVPVLADASKPEENAS
jgi:predicted ABC-type ATPase